MASKLPRYFMRWNIVPTPGDLPAPLPVRGISWLAASDDSRFPESVPHAEDSVLRICPQQHCTSVVEAGHLARQVIDVHLLQHPAILFKGLPVKTRQDFSRFFQACGFLPHDYKGGNAIRDKSPDKVSITSAESPAVVVTPHNENAYMPEPPDLVFFCCLEAAHQGGEAPVNDIRKTPALLPKDFVEEMRRRDLRYIRRLIKGDNEFEIGWQTSFGTSDQKEIERYLESRNIRYQWRNNDLLEFWFNTPVFRQYRGEELWFNQLSECNADYWLLHPESERMGYTRETCQSDTAYGDGEPFPEDVRTMVRAAIWQSTEVIMLEPSDVIVLDNNIMQHGRIAYQGTRRHLAALARFSSA
jgi:hypothetical protein